MNARVFVRLKKSVLDSQGQAIARTLGQMGYDGVADVRVGKLIELELSGEQTEAKVKEMCERLLANTVTEDYEIKMS